MIHSKLPVQQPKISVIIPCYNAEKFIYQTLTSVFSQSYKNIEVIVVDDFSTDDTRTILNNFQQKNEKLKIILQPNHQNAGACRNVGVKQATGEYVHFLDADDWLEVDAYETILKRIGTKTVDACVFQFKSYDNETGLQTDEVNVMTRQKQIVSLKQYPYFLIYSPVMPWNKLIKREVIDKNNLSFDEIECANDRSFYFKLIRVAKRLLIIPDKLIFYRINNAGSLIGSGRAKKFHCNFEAFESSLSAYEDVKPEIREILVDAYVRDFFYFFQRIPDDKKAEVGESIAQFFASHSELFNGNSKWCSLLENLKNGDYAELDCFNQGDRQERYKVFENGFLSGVKLLFYKIVDKLSKRDESK